MLSEPQLREVRSAPSAGTDGTSYAVRLAVAEAQSVPQAGPARPLWEIMIGVAGATAGLGAFLVAAGALVCWLRFVAAGVPAEQALAAMSSPALAVVGAHELAVPALITLLVAVVLPHYEAVWVRKTVGATKAGTTLPEPPILVLASRWHRFTRRCAAALQWVFATRRRRVVAYAVGFPLLAYLVVASLTLSLFERLKIAPMWIGTLWVFWLPFSFGWVACVVGSFALRGWIAYVDRVAPTMGWPLRRIRLLVALGSAISIVAVAMAFQLDKPSQLAPANVSLTNGSVSQGLFVSSDANFVYLAVGHDLRQIARQQVSAVEVGHATAPMAPTSLAVRLVKLVL